MKIVIVDKVFEVTSQVCLSYHLLNLWWENVMLDILN